MRRLILKMSMSLDGFVGSLNREIDWIFASTDAASTAWTMETLHRTGLHAMGSRTFHDMAAYWPASTEVFAAPSPAADRRRGTCAGVVMASAARGSASSLASWRDAAVADGDLAEEVARLKLLPGNDIVAHGGAGFAQSLVRHNLIDEYRLLVHPVVLGRGLALFGAVPEPRKLQLVSATAFPAGAIAQVYQPR